MHPSELDSVAAKRVYAQGGRAALVDKTSYVSIGSDDSPDRLISLNCSDYNKREQKSEDRAIPIIPMNANPVVHGNLEETDELRKTSMTHHHYKAITGKELDQHFETDSKMRKKDGFDRTLWNTMGRLALINVRTADAPGDFKTVIQDTYNDKSQLVEHRQPFPPPVMDVVNGHLHPYVQSSSRPDKNGMYSFKPMRDLSSMTHLHYRAPEVMRFAQ